MVHQVCSCTTTLTLTFLYGTTIFLSFFSIVLSSVHDIHHLQFVCMCVRPGKIIQNILLRKRCNMWYSIINYSSSHAIF